MYLAPCLTYTDVGNPIKKATELVQKYFGYKSRMEVTKIGHCNNLMYVSQYTVVLQT